VDFSQNVRFLIIRDKLSDFPPPSRNERDPVDAPLWKAGTPGFRALWQARWFPGGDKVSRLFVVELF